MIAGQVEGLLEPVSDGNLRICVVSPDGMESQEDGDEYVGDIGERKATVGRDEKEAEHHHQKILEQPVLAVDRRDARQDPKKEVPQGQPLLQAVAAKIQLDRSFNGPHY